MLLILSPKRSGILNLKSVQRTFSREISLKEISKRNSHRKSSSETLPILIVPFWITLIESIETHTQHFPVLDYHRVRRSKSVLI